MQQPDIDLSERCELPHKSGAAGFSLIEVVISIAILLSLTLAVVSMLKSGFDIKEGLSARSKVVHRLQVAMAHLARDIEHAFIISSVKDQNKNPLGRRAKTLFRIDKSGGSEKLALTTKTRLANIKGAFESELTFVVYELKDAKEVSGRKHLYRAETPVIPEDLKEEPPTQVLVRGIKTLTYEVWDGDKWAKDGWDTGRGDWRNRLPKMVKVTIEAFKHDRVDGDGKDQALDEETETLSTVIYLADSWASAEIKQPAKTPKWSGF